MLAPVESAPATTSAPTTVIPEIAFEPLVSGVWSRCGTFVITSKPTHIASRKTVSSRMNREAGSSAATAAAKSWGRAGRSVGGMG